MLKKILLLLVSIALFSCSQDIPLTNEIILDTDAIYQQSGAVSTEDYIGVIKRSFSSV